LTVIKRSYSSIVHVCITADVFVFYTTAVVLCYVAVIVCGLHEISPCRTHKLVQRRSGSDRSHCKCNINYR